MSYEKTDKNEESFIKRKSNLIETPATDADDNNDGDVGVIYLFGVE